MAKARTIRRRRISAEFVIPPDLLPEDRKLLHLAWLVRARAYAPYSHFKVGAAVRSAAGNVYIGCNVETCSYSQTTHAEQAAVAAMVSAEGPDARIAAVAVVAAPEDHTPRDPTSAVGWLDTRHVEIVVKAEAPCGHCLQIICEFKVDRETRLIGYGQFGVVSITTIGDSLPFAFSPEHIK